LVLASKFAAVFFAILPFLIACSIFRALITKKNSIKEDNSYREAEKVVIESLDSIKTVIYLGMERIMIEKFSKKLSQIKKLSIRNGLLIGITNSVWNFLYFTCFAIGIYYAINLNTLDCVKFMPFDLIAAFYAILDSCHSFGKAFPFLKDLYEAKMSALKIYDIINTQPMLDIYDLYLKSQTKKVNSLHGNIQFTDVYFNDPKQSNSNLLNGLNFKIEAGKTIALVGSR
jgi:ABC-type bacteriocin/lantibiotic exporter with double-glycine peptidase domain